MGTEVSTFVPDAPTSLVATPNSDGTIKLTWADSAGNADDFAILWSHDGVDFGLIGTVPATDREYVDEEPLEAHRNYYRVVALEDNRASDPTDVAGAVPAAHLRGVPAPRAYAPYAVYCIARQFASKDANDFAEKAKMFSGDWKGRVGHGYLLITDANGAPVSTYSWHPQVWPKKDEVDGYWDVATAIRNAVEPNNAIAGRVWQNAPADLSVDRPERKWGDKIAAHEAVLITGNQVETDRLVRYINAWMDKNRVGCEKGAPKADPLIAGNTIGTAEHREPLSNVSYWVFGMNCFWWATTMITDSGIQIGAEQKAKMEKYNNGVGARNRYADNDSAKGLLRDIPQNAVQKAEGFLRAVAGALTPTNGGEWMGDDSRFFQGARWETRKSPSFSLPVGFRGDQIPDRSTYENP